jgi:hypothetical protein
VEASVRKTDRAPYVVTDKDSRRRLSEGQQIRQHLPPVSECEEARSEDVGLELVLRAWADLAPPLKAAILALVRTAMADNNPE